jgi:tetratricopeptide (TPR) repeat protein
VFRTLSVSVKQRKYLGCLIAFVTLALVISYAYSNSLSVPWHFDDKTNILDNSWIQISTLSWDEISGAMYGQLSGVLRQTAYLGFALNYYFAHMFTGDGFNTAPWHVVNIILHILTSYLVFLLTFDLLGRTRPKWDYASRFGVSIVTALFFALSPIQTQTVTYIVQRLAGSAAFWYLLTLYLYIKHRTLPKKYIPYLGNFLLLIWVLFLWYAAWFAWRDYKLPDGIMGPLVCMAVTLTVSIPIIWFVARKGYLGRRDGDHWLLLAIFTSFFALTTKENTITIPFFCWFYDYLFISGQDATFKKRSLAGWVTVGIFGVMVSPILINRIPQMYLERDFNVWERVLTQFRVVWGYVFKAIYPNPSRLNLDIEVVTSTSPIKPLSTIFAIIAWYSVIILSFINLKRDKLIPFCILWFFGQLVVESSVLGLEMAYEHRIYLPSWGFFLLVALGIHWVFSIISANMTLLKPSIMKWVTIGLVTVILCSISIAWTHDRNAVWADEIALWRDIIAKSPGKPRPKVNLGYLLVMDTEKLMNESQTAKTQTEFQKYEAQKMLNLSEAEKLYHDALAIDPKSVYAMVNLGHLYLMREEYPRALDIFQKAELIKPNDPVLQFNLGVTYSSLEQKDKAREHYEKALKAKSNYYEALNNLGIIEINDGNTDKAIELFNEATRISRFPALAYYNLGNAYVTKNDLENAAKAYQKALQFKPDYLQAMVNLANVVAMMGDFESAVKIFSGVLKLDANHINTHYNLGLIYMNQLNRPKDALYHFKRVLEINPNVPQADQVEDLIRQLQEETK